MTSKETAPGSNNVPPIPEPPKDFLKNSPFVRGEEQEGGSWFDLMHDIQQAEDAKEDNPGFFRRAGEWVNRWAGKVKERLGDTALVAALTGSEASKGGRDNSRRIDLPTPGSEAGGDSVEDGQDKVSTSTPESQSGDSGEGDQEQGTDKGGVPEGFVEDVFVPTDFDGNPEDPAQTETDDSDDHAKNNSSAESEQHSQDGGEQNQGSDDSAEKTEPAGDTSKVETADDGSEPESADGSAETTKKDLKKERSAVAKELAEAMQKIKEYKPGDPTYEKLLIDITNMRDRFNHIGKQIRGEVDDDEGRDGDKEKGKELVPKGKELVPYDSRVADLDKVMNDSEADGLTKYEELNKLKQKVVGARNKYAEIRAEYEQMGTFKGLFKGKELKKRMELARAELEGYMTQLVYHQKDQERSIIKNGVEGANEEEQKEARQKAIQSIAAAVLEQHALVDEKTQEEYDKRLDERSLFKKVAAKIGRWFVGKENKDGGKLGLGGWLRSGGTGLAAGVATGLLGAGFPITSAVGAAGGAGVKVAAHQRALENARGEKRKLSDEELARFASGAQDLEWTTEEKDGSDRKDQSGEAVASMVDAVLAETQKDTEKRQKDMAAIGRKAAMGWGLGFAAGRVAGGAIKSMMTPDQKPANIADTSGGKGTTLQEGQQGLVSPNTEATQPNPDMLDVPEVHATPPTIGPDVEPWTFMAENYSPEEAMSKLYEAADTLREAGHTVEFVPVSGDQLGMVVDGVSDYSTVNGLVAQALKLKFNLTA